MNWLLRHLDSVAMGISGLCLVQCLATPLLLIFLPVIGGSVLHGEQFHRVLVFVILPTSVVAFVMGCWQHRRWGVLVPASIGLAMIITAAVLGYERLGMTWETIITLIGTLFLAWAHLQNYRLCRDPAICPDHSES
ncbi:MAG: MerC domain-containing protein [Xanthomonadales bacterium]|nr:MerC domain-containing protein [Xanthomonadales bacterium]